MDRRKIGLILGALVGVTIAVVLVLGKSDPPPPRKSPVAPVIAVPPDAGPSREELEARLDQLRAARNDSQSVVDRASRGEPIDPRTVEDARLYVLDMIGEIETAERALRELDQ